MPEAARGPRRWWTAHRLVLSLILIAWGKGCEALTDRFGDVRALWPDPEPAPEGAPGHGGKDADKKRSPGQTYQGFIQAWRQTRLRPALAAAKRLRELMLQEGTSAAQKVCGWVVLAADGSRFALPRTAALEERFGAAGQGDHNPQMWVTLLWHLGLGLPWAWKIGRADASERHHLRALLKKTPLGCLLVMDAGFTGYALLRQIMTGGRQALVRVGRHVNLLKQLGYVEEHDGLVYLWPTYAQRDGLPPLVLRLIRLPRTAGRRRMYLLTSVLDPRALSDEQAETIYGLRWGIELAYRSLKQTLEARKLRSHAPMQVILEIQGLLLGLTVLGWWTRRAVAAGGGNPRRWSVAGAWRTVRKGLHQPAFRQVWAAPLGRAVRDGYQRQRKARVAWARKKQHDPPPGRPHVRKATAAQRRRAAALKKE